MRGACRKALAGKCDQTDAIALQLVEQILGGQLDALEAIRLHIIGKHAARDVDREEEIEPFAFYFIKGIAPARPRQTNDDEGEDEKEEDETHDAPACD